MSQHSLRREESKSRPVVAITGASAGVGRAVARRFAAGGYDVALIARGQAGLRAAKVDVERLGGRAESIKCDVAEAEAVEAAAGQAEQALGPIDVWVNCAMVSVFSPVKEMQPSEFERVTQVTYLGYVYGTLAALRRMLPRDRGMIIQVGSALAYRSIPLQSAYCAAKHAIVGFTDSLRCELIHDRSGVHVTAVHLPATNTPQFDWVKSRLPNRGQPVPPIFQPEVAAEAIYWSAHHRQREVWVGGSTYKAILGQRIFPGFLDRYLARNAYEGQQTDVPRDRQRRHNLWRPLDNRPQSDQGARGSFDDSASNSSVLWELTQPARLVGAAAVGLGIGIGFALYRAMREAGADGR